MDKQIKKISILLGQLNNHIIIINNIITEMNNIISDNKMNSVNLNNLNNFNNTINSLNETSKKINKNNYIMNLNASINTLDKDTPCIFTNINEKITVIFKNFDKERKFIYDAHTPIYKILRIYLKETGSLMMPKKPIFLYKGNSLNPNDSRKIGDITNDYMEITVDFF